MLLLAAWQMSMACDNMTDLNHACKGMAQQLDAFHAGPGGHPEAIFQIQVLLSYIQRNDETCCSCQPGQEDANLDCQLTLNPKGGGGGGGGGGGRWLLTQAGGTTCSNEQGSGSNIQAGAVSEDVRYTSQGGCFTHPGW